MGILPAPMCLIRSILPKKSSYSENAVRASEFPQQWNCIWQPPLWGGELLRGRNIEHWALKVGSFKPSFKCALPALSICHGPCENRSYYSRVCLPSGDVQNRKLRDCYGRSPFVIITSGISFLGTLSNTKSWHITPNKIYLNVVLFFLLTINPNQEIP